ncbi:SDR family oxidoreductase [Dactylosporangium fulvum]
MSASADGSCVRSVVLTGASRGLGAALFQALQADGARVYGLARTFTAEQELLAAQRPASVWLRAGDLGDTGSGVPAPDGLGLAGGGLPSGAELAAFVGDAGPDDEVVLLHNAATVEPIALAGDLPPAAVLAAVNLNLVAPILLTNLFLATFRASRARLRIVYVASAAAHRAYPGWATYCATKAGAEAFMRCVGEAAGAPCEVEIIDPGAIETQMQRTLRDLGAGLPGHARLVERHQVGDIGDPSMVAKGIVQRHFPPLVPLAENNAAAA